MVARALWKLLRKPFAQLARAVGAFRVPRATHQRKHSTSYDRYPGVFTAVRAHADRPVRILSFGCSTGEECFALRDRYFPEAEIVGADVDGENLARCIAANTDPRIHFVASSREALLERAPYDVVFCMSVLCRWPETQHVDDASRVYPFALFEQACRDLHEVLRPGGLLVIYNASFRLRDCELFSKYRVLADPRVTESGFVHKFDRDGRKLADQRDAEVIFVKERE